VVRRPSSRPALALLPLLLPLAAASCAAVPGEELGRVQPRVPVTAQERREAYPIDVYDPLEGLNRRIYRFNAGFDRRVLVPVVDGYRRVLPLPVRRGVSNFFNNLGELRNGLNGGLQGRPDVLGTAFYRFAVNSTLGLLGTFDLATGLGHPERREDFGQTLGRWGVRPGPYLVLPILGPSSLRDAGGTVTDTAAGNVLPVAGTVNDLVYFDPSVYGAYVVDRRHQVGFRYYRSGSPFEYDLVRFLYTKKRELDILR
jgi:phospholipid-binding lipoprotein MlaA